MNTALNDEAASIKKIRKMSATKIIHSIPSDPLTGAISVPVYQTLTFI